MDATLSNLWKICFVISRSSYAYAALFLARSLRRRKGREKMKKKKKEKRK